MNTKYLMFVGSLLCMVISCKQKEELEIVVDVTDFEVTIKEKPAAGQALGIIDASTNAGSLMFSVLSEEPSGAIFINNTTGALTVDDPALFVFKDHPVLAAVIEVRNGDVAKTANVTVNLSELSDVLAENFDATIFENPEEGFVLGTITASTNRGALTFSFVSQDPSGAMAVNVATGELSVANASLFVFASHETIEGVVEVKSDDAKKNIQVTITLEEENGIVASNFAATIVEDPEPGLVLGQISANTNEGTLTFEITDEEPDGAMTVNSSTGELTVANAALFDFETRPLITASVEISNGDITKTIDVEISVQAVTINAEDLEITTLENPDHGSILGTIQATTNKGELQFSIESQEPVGAIEINSTSGELSVGDQSLFVFNNNPVITAVIEIGNGIITKKISATINLKDLRIVFTKVPFSNFNEAANQDRITDNVWLTRGEQRGLFNIKVESSYSDTSPADTEWAEGTTAQLASGTLVFTTWKEAIVKPAFFQGKTFVLHLITDDIYLNIQFLQWTQGVNGGGFSYERSVVPD